jgi:hypothetical protein
MGMAKRPLKVAGQPLKTRKTMLGLMQTYLILRTVEAIKREATLKP